DGGRCRFGHWSAVIDATGAGENRAGSDRIDVHEGCIAGENLVVVVEDAPGGESIRRDPGGPGEKLLVDLHDLSDVNVENRGNSAVGKVGSCHAVPVGEKELSAVGGGAGA